MEPVPVIQYEAPQKPPQNPEAEPFIPGQQAPQGEVPYVPPPDYNWEPGVAYEVGQPVQYEQVYYPDGEAQAMPFEQERINFKKGKKVANKGCHCIGSWGASFFTSVVVLGSLALPFLLDSYLWFILTGVIYLVHWIVFACSDTCKFLQKLRPDVNPYELTYQCQKTPAHTKWHIVCYHYETRTRTTTDSQGNTRTETYTEKVITHTASHVVRFEEQYDASPILSGLERFRMTRIYNKVKIAFVSEGVQEQFESMRRQWIHEHNRDVHHDFSEKHKLPGLISHVLTFNGKRKKFPRLLNCAVFTVLCVVTLDWVVMFWLMRHSARLDYTYLKVVHRI